VRSRRFRASSTKASCPNLRYPKLRPMRIRTQIRVAAPPIQRRPRRMHGSVLGPSPRGINNSRLSKEWSPAMNEGANDTAKRAAKKVPARPRPRGNKADGEAEVVANIAAMSGSDRAIGEGLHAIIKANAPVLSARLWYGMPAYAKDGKVICFFQSAQKFKTRYATFGFQHEANLDEGHMWPVAFAVTEFTTVEEARISALVKKAVS